MRAIATLAVLLGLAAPAVADTVPSGRISAIVGLRNGTGGLDDSFGLGVMYGVEAAWEPLRDEQKLGYVIHWNVLFGNFGSDPAAITGSLDILEMNLGARLRIAPKDPARTLFIGGGAALFRANAPLPPSNERSYVGGFAGFGVEQLAWSRALLTLEIRYGIIGPGPNSVSVLLGVGLGV